MKDLQMQLEKLSKICGVAAAKTMSEVTGEEFISESVAISEANIKMIADYIQDGGYIVNCNCFQVEGRNIHGTMLFLVFEDDGVQYAQPLDAVHSATSVSYFHE